MVSRAEVVSRKVYGGEASASAYDLPCPSNLSYMWSFGSALGIFYTLQLVTGVLLAMHYVPDVGSAFYRVFYIQRDVCTGWLLRVSHANGASILMALVYLHILRGVYFYSFSRVPVVWFSGMVLIIIIMAAAFLGYVLPWGQMSYWGATVITNLFGVVPLVGGKLVQVLWGGYTVGAPALNRFFVFHFLVPLIMAPLVLGHLLLLHSTGSSNPLGCPTSVSAVPFHPYMGGMDLAVVWVWGGLFFTVCLCSPHALGCVDNFEHANSLNTPLHIVPEWYFLPFYAILRSIPHKTGGVVTMVVSLFVFFLLTVTSPGGSANNGNCIIREGLFWCFVFNGVVLGWVGGCPLEVPFLSLGLTHTILFFVYFALDGMVCQMRI